MSTHHPAPGSDDPTPGRPAMPPGYGVGPEPTAELLSWSWVSEQLSSARNYWVASTRPDGRPHVAPVWGLWLDRALYFSTDPTSRKGRNLAARPNVAVHLESGDEAVMLEGRVEIGIDAALLARFLDAYEVKYALRPDLNALNGAVDGLVQHNGRSKSDAAAASPLVHQRGRELQRYGTLRDMPIGLEDGAREQSVDQLNQILADTITLRDMYKKHHWQVAGPTFYPLHLLFDKHYVEQNELVDLIAERIQLLGGISIAMAHDVAETTRVERPPRGAETVPVQISRLLEAHELIIKEVREAAEAVSKAGDEGTNDMLVSQVLRTNELQTWFVAEHVVEVDLVEA